MSSQTTLLPTIALRGTTILPGMIVHFDVSRTRSVKAIEASMLADQKIFLITQKNPETEIPSQNDLYQIGCEAYIKQVVKLPQHLIRVLVEGLSRAELLQFRQEYPYLQAETEPVEEESEQYYDTDGTPYRYVTYKRVRRRCRKK